MTPTKTFGSSGTPQWVQDYLYRHFYSSSTLTPEGRRWIQSARRWMRRFLTYLGATEIRFNQMHFDWSLFAKLGDQWWYFSSGDVRYKIMPSLLVRTASGPKDYTGGHNQYVSYKSSTFAADLRRILEN